MARSTLFLKAGDLNRKQLMKRQKIDKKILNVLASCTFKGLPRFDEGDYKKVHITKEMVKKALPDIKDKDAEIIAQEVSRVAKKFHLDTELRLSHFFGQIYHESAKGAKTTEDLVNYRRDRLRGVLKKKPYYLLHPDKLDSDIKGFYHLPKEERRKAIGSKMYWYKGEPGPDSQHDYSGKGYIQLTHRSNYIDFNKWYHKHYNENINFVQEPEKVAGGKYAIISAIYYWEKHKLYIPADKNDADGVSRLINPKDKIESYKLRKIILTKISIQGYLVTIKSRVLILIYIKRICSIFSSARTVHFLYHRLLTPVFILALLTRSKTVHL